jgi:hypothetical protein
MSRGEKMKERPSRRAQTAKRPTLVDVAREAGVGTTTVSRIINGGHYNEESRVSAQSCGARVEG